MDEFESHVNYDGMTLKIRLNFFPIRENSLGKLTKIKIWEEKSKIF